MKRYVALTIATLVLVSAASFAQVTLSIGQANLHSGKVGLGLDGITGSPNILLKYFFTDRVAAQAIFGFDIYSPGGDAIAGRTKVNGVTVRGGASLLYHITQDQVTPYIGGEFVYQTSKAAGFYITVPDPKQTLTMSGVFGAEYFISERFSIGIREALGLSIYLSRNVPHEETDTEFATETLMTGRFYFN
jgi:hypothetical protein